MLRIELKNLLPLRQSSTLNPLFIHTQEGMDLNRLNILSTVALSLLSQDDSELPTTKDQTNEAFIIQLVAAIDIYLKKLVLSSIYTSQDTSKRKMVTSTNKDVKKQRIPVDRSMENSSSPVVLIDHWRETVQSMNLSSNDTHKHTFILLCQSLRDQCPPSLTNVPNEHASAGLGRIDDDTQHIGWTEKIYTSLIHRLNTKLPSPSKLDTSLLDCKMWCLYVLHNQSGGWKSVLKVMIQFCDLWTSEMTDPSYMKVFSVMISKENLVVELYHRDSVDYYTSLFMLSHPFKIY
ncbi:hypothetical protein BDF14DRAFT_1364759 [Spinellus fusiger]|nr:hypothetical protein BDF14DRAFT_1364759 [Spinellus fusiger]